MAVLGSDSSGSDWNDSDEDLEDGDNEDENVFLNPRRTLLWLCQEGQIQVARRRFDFLSSSEDEPHREQLYREVFQMGRDKNYALHEILMGGTSDRNARALTIGILDYSRSSSIQQMKMLSVQPPSHRRTALHWAAWGNADMGIIKALVQSCPEAILMRDKVTQGERTPIEILKRYFLSEEAVYESEHRLVYLERCAKSWTSHRLRVAIHLCANRTFVSSWGGEINRQLTPFSKNDRKLTGMKPRAWFLLSVIGFLLQREMKTLADRIISFAGGNARVKANIGGKRNKKRKRGSAP